jgi:hypothetical protein
MTYLVLHRKWPVLWGSCLPVCAGILVLVPYTEYPCGSAARIVAGQPALQIASLLLFPGPPCKVFNASLLNHHVITASSVSPRTIKGVYKEYAKPALSGQVEHQ